MGKVFSWEEIRDKKVPELASFPILAQHIRKSVTCCDGIIGGILCGSMLWNNFNQRSDIDCVAVYDQKVVEVFQKLHSLAISLHIPLELITIDLAITKTLLHHIGLSFSAHLEYAVNNGGMIKNNPLPLFVFAGFDPINDVRGYLRNKMRRLEKGINTLPAMEDNELYKFLQKVLEAPLHIARKMLWYHKVEIPNDSKQTVLRYYPHIATSQEMRLFSRIMEIDYQYTMELLEQVNNPDENSYSVMVKSIKCVALDALEFTKINALRLA